MAWRRSRFLCTTPASLRAVKACARVHTLQHRAPVLLEKQSRLASDGVERPRAEDAESKVTKDKLQQVLRDFELNDDVDKVILSRVFLMSDSSALSLPSPLTQPTRYALCVELARS
jgi:hypothetical protein